MTPMTYRPHPMAAFLLEQGRWVARQLRHDIAFLLGLGFLFGCGVGVGVFVTLTVVMAVRIF